TARRGDRDRRGDPALLRGATGRGARARRAARRRGQEDLRGTGPRDEPRGGVPRRSRRRHRVRAVPIIAGYALQEALRRRIFHVVLLLTLLYVSLYWLGARTAFDEVAKHGGDGPVDDHELTGGTLFGLSMFGTLFLGAVLAAFLTLGVVRGDAERGLLQPLVVRPVGRSALLLGRFLGAAA